MSDLVKKLRSVTSIQVETDESSYEEDRDLAFEAADEIESLRARLEVDPSHPYDGIYARDETIRGLEKQIESLRQKTQYWPDNAERDAVIRHQKGALLALRAYNERLRAALSEIAKYEIEEGCPCNACQHSALARAALEQY